MYVQFFLGSQKNSFHVYIRSRVVLLYFAQFSSCDVKKKNLLSFEEINHAPNYPLYLPSIIISVAAAMYNNQMQLQYNSSNVCQCVYSRGVILSFIFHIFSQSRHYLPPKDYLTSLSLCNYHREEANPSNFLITDDLREDR